MPPTQLTETRHDFLVERTLSLPRRDSSLRLRPARPVGKIGNLRTDWQSVLPGASLARPARIA